VVADLNEHIDFRLRHKTRDGCASNVVYVNQFIAKGTSDERLIRLKTGGPGRILASDFAGQSHCHSLA